MVMEITASTTVRKINWQYAFWVVTVIIVIGFSALSYLKKQFQPTSFAVPMSHEPIGESEISLPFNEPALSEPAPVIEAFISIKTLLDGRPALIANKSALPIVLEKSQWQLVFASNTHKKRSFVTNRAFERLSITPSDLGDPHVMTVTANGLSTLALIQGNTLRFTLRRDNGRVRLRYRGVIPPDGGYLQGNLTVERNGKILMSHPWVGQSI